MKYSDQEIENLRERYKADDTVLELLAHVVKLQRSNHEPPKRQSQFIPGGWVGHRND